MMVINDKRGMVAAMPRQSPPPRKTKLTDAERHARFREMAREVGADDTEAAAERAFNRVVTPPERKHRETP
jgi:hypothetical protein